MDTRPSLGIGIDVPAGQVILRVIVATTQDQQGLDEKYGVDAVRLQGELVPARQREPLIATSPVWPTHLDRTQPEPESYRRLLGALDHDEFAGRDIAGYPRGPDHR
jgi:hypothetical protein